MSTTFHLDQTIIVNTYHGDALYHAIRYVGAPGAPWGLLTKTPDWFDPARIHISKAGTPYLITGDPESYKPTHWDAIHRGTWVLFPQEGQDISTPRKVDNAALKRGGTSWARILQDEDTERAHLIHDLLIRNMRGSESATEEREKHAKARAELAAVLSQIGELAAPYYDCPECEMRAED